MKKKTNSEQQQVTGTVDRRRFLTAAAVGAGVIGTGVLGAVVAGRGYRVANDAPLTSAPDADVKALFGPLVKNGQLHEWTVDKIYGVYLGAIPVILHHKDGDAFQIDVLRRDPTGPQGVGNTDNLSLYVANTGNGAQRTDKTQGLGAVALANYLAKRDTAAAKLGSLLTLSERHQRHPDGIYTVL